MERVHGLSVQFPVRCKAEAIITTSVFTLEKSIASLPLFGPSGDRLGRNARAKFIRLPHTNKPEDEVYLGV